MKKFNVDEICNRFTDSEITLRYNEIRRYYKSN